ncbi:hypothetical protein [Paraburkholderia domus]|uniref:hypothetical protein n=1 Tax=Paraburkholderia domus TaxID=2793075 RepID=UPI0019137439|nr:hypothetical protein [Paraburkholderia domus]MBK5048301.1 hypothetical protein [Burkholderia sp. R-70006]MBK5060530.1 hypothetical protein [Burkholderia sp. R-70199]MBK5085554.1 hypothetical protein [Burkholderia sp. R-69927]MBK5121963.1 hypothetical protein [Burkholderia sp. R-69980]MBK5164680.1 hypothetical protein [Burkholderia sp. R-70211]MBK5181883.1 hypothetical protein [Burkholderia sp. R-69749]MCI0147860.1 hypothetical protein [Paraburkholderia sediminicola]
MPKFELQVFESPECATHFFQPVVHHGTPWDLSHLDSFAFKCDLGLSSVVTVLVMFSCHCFSHSFARDGRARIEIPNVEIYDDGREQRVLDLGRYELSKHLLRDLVMTLGERPIIVADEQQPNFMTLQKTNADGTTSLYAVFFEVEKDRARKQRLILRVQSAYLLEKALTKRQRQAKKVAFKTLLRATYEGRKIRP